MSAVALLADLRRAGVRIEPRGERLYLSAASEPPSDLLERVRAAKAELLRFLRIAKSDRVIVHFRIAGDTPNAWATAIGAPGDTVDRIVRDLEERLGNRLAEWRPRRAEETH